MFFLWIMVTLFGLTMTERPKLKKITINRGILYESPFWDEEFQSLYWLDIKGRTVHQYNGDNIKQANVDTNMMISGIIPLAKAKSPHYFVIGIGTDITLLHWPEDGELTTKMLTTVDLGKPGNRFNDAKCDREGRLWFGTMGEEVNNKILPDKGSLYLVTQENYLNPEEKISPVSISNGMAWSKDDKTFFYIDSPSRVVAGYDYDAKTGIICNRRVVFDFNEYNLTGVPDGMTIDRNDNLWIAGYNTGAVLKVNSSDGKLITKYIMPAMQVTSVIWGGKDLDVLYVTTAAQHMSEEQLENHPGAGHVYSLRNLGESGFKSQKFNMTYD